MLCLILNNLNININIRNHSLCNEYNFVNFITLKSFFVITATCESVNLPVVNNTNDITRLEGKFVVFCCLKVVQGTHLGQSDRRMKRGEQQMD